MIALRQRLVRRSALLAQIAALGFAASVANAAVVDSGPVSISVPNTTAGVYLNVVTNVSNPVPASAPGWDFNPWGNAGNLAFFTSTAAANTAALLATGGNITTLTTGQQVGPAGTFATGTQNTVGSACRTTTTTACIVGIRFNRETTTTTHFGYAILSTTAPTGFPATITRYFYEDTANTAITVGGGGNTPPIFAYTPAAGSTVPFTGGGAVGSTGSASIAVAVGTAGSGTGAPATTTTTCTAPTAPFAGFGQTVSAVGNGAITGSPLSGTCTLGAAAATQTLTCSENRGGTPTAVTFTLSCPAGTLAPVTSNPTSGTAVAFGNIGVGATATRTITFSNSAGTPQTVTCTAPAAPFSAAPLSIPVPAGGTATTTITFTGTAVGTYTGTLNCTAGATAFTFPITGGVTPAPVATSVPALGDAGRWIAMLMLLAVGLVAVAVRRS